MIKIKTIILIFLFIFPLMSFAQVFKDTVYVYFDSTKVGMKKYQFKTIKSKKYPNENIKTSFSYKIDEKKVLDTIGYDKGYTFTHYNWDKHSLEFWKLKNPSTIIKDTSFLKTIKLLGINFFLNTDYRKVCTTFNKAVYGSQKVFIFMIDKDEIKNGKIILREVTFSPPHKI